MKRKGRGTRRFAAAALFALACGAPSWAAATPSVDEDHAVALYEQGNQLLQHGNPAAGLPLLEESMELLPSPNTELLVGHALRQLGRKARAYERYVHVRGAARARLEAGEARFGPTVKDAERWITALTPEIGELSVTATDVPADSALYVEGRRVEWLTGSSKTVRSARSYEEPGRLHVELRAKGEVLRRAEVDLTKGATRAVTLEPIAQESASNAPAVTPDDGIPPPPLAAWIAFGVGAAGMVSFAVSGGLALSAANELDACAPHCDASDPALRDARDDGKRDAAIANVSVAVGATGLVAGGLLWIFWPREKEPTSSMNVDVGPFGARFETRF